MNLSRYAPRRVIRILLRRLRKRYGREESQKKASRPTTRQVLFKEVRAYSTQHLLQHLMLTSTESGVSQTPKGSPRVIVSLTSIPERLYDVPTTIESLLQQTFKPDAIILWLDERRCNDENLPIALQRQKRRGLTVRYCEDIGPHTKLIPALRAYPNDIVITVDDDVLYPDHLVERLIRAYQQDATKIYCTRARCILGVPEEAFSYERDWPNLYEQIEGLHVFPLGVGGVLYPPGIFGDDEVFNLRAQRELAPKADDIWFKAMSLRKGVVCKRLHFHTVAFPVRPLSQEVELGQYNVAEGGNEWQLKATFARYDLWDVVKETLIP